MSEMTLEARVAALERALADVQQRLPAPPKKNWWESDLPPMTPDQLDAFDAVVEYGKYFRRTGVDAPPDWKPGDPIPEPDEADDHPPA